MKSRVWMLSGVGLLSFSLTGCPNKATVKQEPEMQPQQPQAQPPAEEPSIRVGPEYKEVPELQPVYFDLDQSTLRSDARDVLQKNYEALKAHPDWEALVEGHCDERGTTEYNLGLGQKRAASARQYYMTLGQPGTRIATISYGKENPTCSEHSEDCWSKNRRAVTKVRSVQGKGAGAVPGGTSAAPAAPAAPTTSGPASTPPSFGGSTGGSGDNGGAEPSFK
jgi:peptidoglycan-associated lipoprotein